MPAGTDVFLTGEYTPFNLMHQGSGLSAMFDFGDSLAGPREYDWLGPLCFLAAGDAARIDAFFDGHHGRPFDTIGPALGKSRNKVLKLNESTFSKVTDDVRNAALIPQDRKLAADEIQSTCQFAFEQIFGA